MQLEKRYREAATFEEFVARAEKNRDLWRQLYERARIPPEAVARVEALPGRWRLLVLTEDWCGDAVNTVPLMARLAAAASNLELRLVRRDENPELMDRYLTDGSRSIPIAIVLDEEFRERGAWGPRPEELQRWVIDEGLDLESEERYRIVRRWYARDRGATTLAELVSRIEAVTGRTRATV